MKHIFISYVGEDIETIRIIKEILEDIDVHIWIDREKLIGGCHWKKDIVTAIRDGGIFLACFSNNSLNKRSSYMNKELKIAIKELKKKPNNQRWFIPLKIDDCNMQKVPGRLKQTLENLQWVDFSKDFDSGVNSLLAAVLPIIKPGTYWFLVLKEYLNYHIKKKIDHFTQSGIQRFKEIEDKWKSLLLDNTVKGLSTAIFELQERAKNTNLHEFEQIIESDREIILSFVPHLNTTNFKNSFTSANDNTNNDISNPYLQFILDRCRKNREYVGWENKDFVHIIYFSEGEEVLLDINYIICNELSMVATGYLIDKQEQAGTKGKYSITYEGMYPTSIINAGESSQFHQILRTEEARVLRKE